MSTSHCLGTGFRKAPASYFSFLDEIGHSTGDFFNGRVRVDPMLVIKIDVIRMQPFE